MIGWEKLLNKTEYFNSLSSSEITPLLDMAIEKKFTDKEIIFSEGDKKDFLYVLGSGTVLISKVTEDGEESLLNILTTGEFFPHSGLFDDQPYPGTATAKKDVVVLMIPLNAFEQFVEANPKLAYQVIKVMSKKIYMLQKKLNEMITLNVEARLLATLRQLSVSNKSNKIVLTHQELGNIVGASRETVTRQLKNLEKQDKVELKKEHILLK